MIKYLIARKLADCSDHMVGKQAQETATEKAAEKKDTQMEDKPAGNDDAVPKKRGRPAKAPADKTTDKPKQAAPKATEAGQEGKRPRGRPPGDCARVRTCMLLLDDMILSSCCSQALAKSRRQQQRKRLQKMPAKTRCCYHLICSRWYVIEAISNDPSIWRFDLPLQAALEGEGTASTNEDVEEAKEPAQKKGKKKTTTAAAS